MTKPQPFLKWAGGKRQLINTIEKNLPEHIKKEKEIDVFVEPFLGGGALFFYLNSNYNVKRNIINDINKDLILAYKVIQKYPDELIKKLENIEKEFLNLKHEDRRIYFYENLRTPFNELPINYEKTDKEKWIEKASLLIALNKTCFNGLFRQNGKGEFNVPFGRYINPKILNKENIRNCHKVLIKTEILCTSYKDIKLDDSPKALIYFDPPYRPLNSSSFTKYSKEDFNDKDQKELAKYFKKLDKVGHYLLLSNSDTKDNFFEELYKGYNIQRISAKRYINCNANNRGDVNELLIKNY